MKLSPGDAMNRAILDTSKGQVVSLDQQGKSAHKSLCESSSPSYRVRGSLPKTASPFGISHQELPWLTGGMNILSRHGVGVFISISAKGRPERLVRDLAGRAKSRIALYQRRAHKALDKRVSRVQWLLVYEPLPELHAHFVATFPTLEWAKKAIASFSESDEFRRHGPETIDVRLVDDWDGLTGYLAKYSTPQAWYAAGKSYRRVPGSYPLGEGGGDRIIASRDLTDALVRSGAVEPRKRTYASRTISQTKSLPTASAAPSVGISSPGYVEPRQLPLFDALSEGSVIRLVEEKRLALGLSQRAVASQLGGLGQSGYANALRGHDKLGTWRRNRALEWLRLDA